MSEQLVTRWGDNFLALPHSLDEMIEAWDLLRRRLLQDYQLGFTRDELAYVASFLAPESLIGLVESAFGPRERFEPATAPRRLLRPRADAAVWLPNNVSLLGPLLVILLSLAGCRVRMKAASDAEDLTFALLDLARHHGTEPLASYVRDRVEHLRLGRDDPRVAELAASTELQIFFGSDTGAAAVMGMPRPVRSVWVPFVDRRSEAWIEPAAASDDTLMALLRVFAIYGQAGCTSPGRVVLLDASERQAHELADRLYALWPRVITAPSTMHVASINVMTEQWALALGYRAQRTSDGAAVIASGALQLPQLPPAEAPRLLPVVAASRADALAALPENIQTVGHALERPDDPAWVKLVAQTRIARFVPLAQMHHFGALWDGYPLLSTLFEHVEVRW
ncbi:acyl-CoA reductase [Mycolicibacterium sp. Dal123E01]|uniref:acyl-CoA reductase n=1 Tax=Mycolicibacterium sp. Dal123E01 TaxID=3457578 RepID=UPI00403E3FA4